MTSQSLLSRNTPFILKIAYKRLKLFKQRNKHTIFIGVCCAIALIVISGAIWAIVSEQHYYNQVDARKAAAHHYKAGEAAYCNQGQDDNSSHGGGWRKCNIITVNNPWWTNYAVRYGDNSTANIHAVDMMQEAKL